MGAEEKEISTVTSFISLNGNIQLNSNGMWIQVHSDHWIDVKNMIEKEKHRLMMYMQRANWLQIISFDQPSDDDKTTNKPNDQFLKKIENLAFQIKCGNSDKHSGMVLLNMFIYLLAIDPIFIFCFTWILPIYSTIIYHCVIHVTYKQQQQQLLNDE